MDTATMPNVVAHDSTPEDIFGWFDFAEVYDRAIATAPPGSVLVEVGVFLGKSLVYLAAKAKQANKGLRVYGVDAWRGSAEFDGTVWFNDKPANEVPGQMLMTCYDNIQHHGLADDVTLIVSDSARAASLFADGSVHMAFIDAAHDEESVARDIAAWRPKIAAGGLLAGHDYPLESGFPGVKAAVDMAFGDRVKTTGASWGVWL